MFPGAPFSATSRRRALLAYWAAALGLPVPPPPVIKDGGKQFMCQGQACGCQTAEECWRHCCCHTPEERWAWAEANHIQPPDYAEKPAPTTKPVRGLGLSSALVASVVFRPLNAADTATKHEAECNPTEADHSSCCPCCRGGGALPGAPSRDIENRVASYGLGIHYWSVALSGLDNPMGYLWRRSNRAAGPRPPAGVCRHGATNSRRPHPALPGPLSTVPSSAISSCCLKSHA